MLNPVKMYERNLIFLEEKGVQELLRLLRRGIEKEGLRVNKQGSIAMTPHPRALGSALTNPWLTTDFSEALLEFITPVSTSIEGTLAFLRDIHALFYKKVEDEIIWAGSMPCLLPDDDQIPVAQYGTSNIARMKTVYRKGLVRRYGSAMQTIAGVHYNFSMPDDYWQAVYEEGTADSGVSLQDFISQRYLDLIRNFRRNYWLFIYLWGAAPCFDRSFVRNREHQMESLGENDLYLPYATSLRMGDLGYQSTAQKSIFVCYNKLETYIQTLRNAIHKPYKEYERTGVTKDGEYLQLNTAILQIENEFYSPIRPKRVTESGKTPLRALRENGVEYVEIRCVDVNPFFGLGIDAETVRFLDIFLLYCLLKDSPLCDEKEFQYIADNQARIVNQGRDPALMIHCGDRELPMRNCASGLLKDMKPLAEILDKAHHNTLYSACLENQLAKVEDDTLTPSARILKTLSDNQQSLLAFTRSQSEMFAGEFRAHQIAQEDEKKLLDDVTASIEDQHELEQNNSVSFEEFLAAYYRQ